MTNTATPRSWVQLTTALAQKIEDAMASGATREPWQSLWASVPASVEEADCQQKFTLRLAEAVLCVRVVSRWVTHCDHPDMVAMWDWLRNVSRPPFQQIFQAAVVSESDDTAGPLGRIVDATCDADALAHLGAQLAAEEDNASTPVERIVRSYERLSHRHHRKRRGTYGIYYTPRPVTAHIVRSVDEILRHEFQLVDGLADTTTWRELSQRSCTSHALDDLQNASPFLSILDPAVGTGAFIVEIVEHVHRGLVAKWSADTSCSESLAARWNSHVSRYLLPSLHGWEILLPAAALAHVAVACQLAATGYDFRTEQPLQIHWRNSLVAPAEEERERFTVIVGNPPYSALSKNDDGWITRLLHGDDCGRLTHNYFEVAGEALGERKVWLHDDYVKFFRLAQCLLEQSGRGVLAYITNRGFLDNLTFRGVRYQLMQSFAGISIVDLHGGRKAHEQTPTGETDENIFDIEQGVAIGFLRSNGNQARIEHVDLWGARRQKEECLKQHTLRELATEALSPRAPGYELIPGCDEQWSEYDAAHKLTELMPMHATAPVTARDGFVVAFAADELSGRMQQFADLSVSDERIRETFFRANRSRQYLAGDTRGWKLADARRRMAQETSLESFVRPCWYRPFDRRWIFWADWMVDWPRTRVTRYFDQPRLALVARRQMLISQPCNFFWVIDDLAVDGIIRSDNRGSESIFPLYSPESQGVANLASDSVWNDVAPETMLYYIYALFHSMSYRTRYAAALRRDFPRVLVPQAAKVSDGLVTIGRELVELHLLRAPDLPLNAWDGPGENAIAKGYPQYHDERVYINSERWLAPVSVDTWGFRVGAHQVASKWLKDRRGRHLSEAESSVYRHVIHAISRTTACMQRIEDRLTAWGGIERAFG